jgi:mannose-6-phosphate isomerase-like protein (cupin superfamily)
MSNFKSFDSPDETREFPKAKMDVVRLATHSVARGTLEPGWKWSESIKPIVGTESCQKHHVGYVVSGRGHVVLDDGTEFEYGSGNAYDIPPGHDAWVVGNEPLVVLEFESTTVEEFGKK